MKITYAPGIRLKCSQCGNHNVEISHIFGLWCTFCLWYRNNQSGMLRGSR